MLKVIVYETADFTYLHFDAQKLESSFDKFLSWVRDNGAEACVKPGDVIQVRTRLQKRMDTINTLLTDGQKSGIEILGKTAAEILVKMKQARMTGK